MIIGLFILQAMFALAGLIALVELCRSFTDSFWHGKPRSRDGDPSKRKRE